MVMEDNEQPPAPSTEASAPRVEERPLWEFSRDEHRVLIITFVGGVASIVVGASVIGGAIALVRAIKPAHSLLVFLIFITAVYILVVVLAAIAWNHWRRPGPRVAGISWLLAWVGLSILLLVWIGLAAGIH
jgi:hypothetical protein